MAPPRQNPERGTAPRVSVIIPLYNGAATISRALQSVFEQTFSDFEIVVVNDGSTDDTASVLAAYGDRIRVVAQPNRGLPSARNSGIRASSGEYVAFLDDDDEWSPQMLARCADVLDQDPDCGLVYAGVLKVDLAGRPMPDQSSENEDIDSPTMEQMLGRPWVVVPSRVMVRRAVLDQCGGFEECLTACEDVYFLLRARECGYFRRVPELLVRKATRPLYPKALKREPASELLVRLVRDRYGASAAGFLREYRRSRVKVMKHMARILMQERRRADARKCLSRVIYYEPASPKAYRRYLRTFLPMRSRRAASNTEDSEA
jgi:glycosyltransferase involved in cell wall biosynthesis